MKSGLKALMVGGILLAGASAPALARDHVNFSLSFGVPVAPAYVAPAPVYYPPAPVYYTPPAPVVYYRPVPAPVYYAPPAVGFTYYTGPGWRHYHHGHRHR